MAAKRIRCVCGKIYDPSIHEVCPDCGTPPPFPTAAAEPASVVIPPVPPEKMVMLDSDRKKRPWLYLQESLPFLNPKKIVLAGGVLGMLVVAGFLLRPRPTPIPKPQPDIVKQTDSAESMKNVVAITPADLPAEIARAKSGATIKLAPGTYRGSFTIEKPLHLIGDNAAGLVIIQNENGTGIVIKSTGVVLENIAVTASQGGDFTAIKVLDQAALELRKCMIDGATKLGVLALGTAKISAQSTTFSTRDQGTGCQLEDTATCELTDCLFKNNRWGYTAYGAVQGSLTGCQFEQNGRRVETGYSLGSSGEKVYLKIERCTFANNFRGVAANEKSHIILTSCTFKNNGVEDKKGNTSFGAIGGYTGGQFLINDCTFDSNRQGVALYAGSSAKLENCTLTNTGMTANTPELVFSSNAFSATGKDTKLSLYKTNIRQSLRNGINLVDGANLEMDDCEVSGGLVSGLVIDASQPFHSEATIINCRFIENKRYGISINPDSVAKVSKCQISNNGASGVYITGDKATIAADECEISHNGECGVLATFKAFAVFDTCTFVGNTYGVQTGTAKSKDGAGLFLSNCTISESSGFAAGSFDGSLTLTDCKFANNKKNLYRAGGLILEQWKGEKPAPSDQQTGVEPTGLTGGKTGMEPTTPEKTEKRQSTPKRKKTTSSGTTTPERKANEIIRNVMRFIPH